MAPVGWERARCAPRPMSVRRRLSGGALRTNLGNAGRPSGVVCGFIGDAGRTRAELLAESAMIRLQLIVAARSVKGPVFHAYERRLLVLLVRALPRRRDALLLVKPETILRWHREGFRLLWRWRSKGSTKAKTRIDPGVVELIRRMTRANRLWGAERIGGELLKLGIRIAKRTEQEYMRGARHFGPHRGQSWRTFLGNHTVWACDFLQTYDIWFRPIFAFFVVVQDTRRVVHVGVTRAPSHQWTAQQLQNATPFGAGPQLLVRDRDDKFGADFDRVATGVGIRVVRTAVRAPLMNSVCERFVGSVRRECLEHGIVLGEAHLQSVLNEYALRYFNVARPHQGIAQRIPVPANRRRFARSATVVAFPTVSGMSSWCLTQPLGDRR